MNHINERIEYAISNDQLPIKIAYAINSQDDKDEIVKAVCTEHGCKVGLSITWEGDSQIAIIELESK